MIKIPALFKKPLPVRRFEKLLRLIEQPADNAYLRSVFERRPPSGRGKEDLFVIKQNLDKEDEKKLKHLAKAIKSNSALPVKFLPVAASAAVIIGGTFFFTVLMNPLLEKALEAGLENIFEARSDVTAFRLNLLRFRISIASVTVANKESPMTNLFEMDRIEFRLLPQAVLRGKIYIEEMRADGMRFGTARETSGALARFPQGEDAPAKPSAPPLVDLGNFDASALLERELDKMRSITVYNEAIAFYEAADAQWRERTESAERRYAELNAAAKPFMDLNLASIDVRNPANLQNLVQLVKDAKTAYDSVNNAVNEVNSIVDGIGADVSSALALKKAAENAVFEDINRLKSYIDIGGGGYHQVLDPILQEILSATAQEYVRYGKIALNALEKVKELQAKLPKTDKKEKKPEFKGRDVAFPTRSYPFFYIGILASDWTARSWQTSFDLRNVSSEPDLIDAPVSLALHLRGQEGDKIEADFDGIAEFRSGQNRLFDAKFRGAGFPVAMNAGLEKMGAGGFEGRAEMTVNAGGMRDGSWNMGAAISVTEPRLVSPEGIVATAVDEAVRETGLVKLGADYIHAADAEDNFKLDTNLGALIAASLKKTAAAYVDKALARAEEELRSRLAPSVNKLKLESGEVDALFALARGDKSKLTVLRGSLDERIKAMEAKVKSAAEDKAKEAAGNAIKGALGGKLPF